MNFKTILGIAGVHYRENARAKRIGSQFEILVLIALLAVFVQVLLYYSESELDTQWVSVLIWVVFTAELIVNLFNVTDKVRYLRQNWMNVLIVIVAFPWIAWGSDWAVVIRSLRLLLFLRFFAHFYKDMVAILKRHKLGQILMGAAFLIVGSGGMFAYIEDRDILDGIWYSLVTVTTVGYGDIVPETESGRIFGGLLILFGVVLFSLVTANISAFLIGTGQRKQEREILEYVHSMEERIEQQSKDNQQHVEMIVKHMTKEIRELKEQIKEINSK
ncbi:MAG: ion channel [Pseudomonadota bacterium]|nr:ion channel [Pseudomonadota bacterium]